MAKRLVVMLLLAGCRQILGLEPLPRDGAADTSSEQLGDGLPCFGTLARACFDPSGAQDVDLQSDIDTDTDAQCFAISHPGESPDLCVIFGAHVHVGSVTVTGNRALVIVATDTIVIGGRLDASSSRSGGRGAGLGMCASGDGAQGLAGGGGAGGSFGGLGGAGGASGGGTVGGMPLPIQPVSNVHGGCAGGRGGGLSGGGAGGPGGGAISLVAATSILVDGSVIADGAGGTGGTFESGGGGGGSGGLVALEAPAIDVPGELVANSGAGGEGAGQNTGANGNDGQLQYDKPAIGGSGATASGGDGGDGTAASVVNGASGSNGVTGVGGGGGGGGGGGAGVVWVKGALTGTRISPPPLMN